MIKTIDTVLSEVRHLVKDVPMLVDHYSRLFWNGPRKGQEDKGITVQAKESFDGPTILALVKYAQENNFAVEVDDTQAGGGVSFNLFMNLPFNSL